MLLELRFAFYGGHQSVETLHIVVHNVNPLDTRSNAEALAELDVVVSTEIETVCLSCLLNVIFGYSSLFFQS